MRSPVIAASLFSIVLGLIGWGSNWRAATRLWGLPAWIGEAIMLLAVCVWTLLLTLYAGKWLWHRHAAQAELAHAVQGDFVALVPASAMLVALAVLPYTRAAAVGLYVLGLAAWLGLALVRHGASLRGARASGTSTPLLYLPVVAGNFIASLVAGALGWSDWGQLLFGAGLLSWLALESVVLQRLLGADPLAPALRPTLGIQLAPPSVGLVAYLGLSTGAPGIVANMLLGYALLQALLLIRLLPWIRAPYFSTSYWAFSFGVSGMALGAQGMAERVPDSPAAWLAPGLFLLSNLVMGGLSLGSAALLLRGKSRPLPTTG